MSDFKALTTLHFKKIFYRGKRYEQPAIEEAIDHLAGYLKKSIHSPSPFVMLAAYNSLKTLIAFYAILRAGKIVVLLDPATKSIELSEMIEETDPGAILFINNSTESFSYPEEIIFRTSKGPLILNSDLSDVCTILFTNAEDGYSKGAMITEKSFMADMYALCENNKINEKSITCALLPFSHLFGLMEGVIIPTHAGGTSLMHEVDLMQLQRITSEINEYRVTHFYSTPAIYYFLSKCPGIDSLLMNVDALYSGGIKLPESIFTNFFARTGKKIRDGYGLTECSPAVTGMPFDLDPVINSIGRPFTGVSIKILDDTHKECPADTVGEICIKGDILFKGYLNHEKATNEILKDGWLHSGDYGKIDREGNIYFCGLKKDMINVAGINVYPKKLQRLMLKGDNAEEVSIQRCESLLQGEVVKAVVRLKERTPEKEEQYRLWCQENITNHQLPKLWEFV